MGPTTIKQFDNTRQVRFFNNIHQKSKSHKHIHEKICVGNENPSKKSNSNSN